MRTSLWWANQFQRARLSVTLMSFPCSIFLLFFCLIWTLQLNSTFISPFFFRLADDSMSRQANIDSLWTALWMYNFLVLSPCTLVFQRLHHPQPVSGYLFALIHLFTEVSNWSPWLHLKPRLDSYNNVLGVFEWGMIQQFTPQIDLSKIILSKVC